MTTSDGWSASVRIERADPAELDRLARALAPEATREVPRASARVLRPAPRLLELAIEARDTGALRAALNTYLGWIALAAATESVAGRA